MNEKELLIQLNNLKNIKPDNQWKNDNREILLNQISSSQEEVKISWFRMLENMLPQQLIRQLSQPVWAVILIMAIVFGGGIVSLNAARDTKPGDSLYIAKVISEKAQLAVTFNEKEKAKLGIEFAGNRTREITQVLAEVDSQEKDAQAKVEKLTKDFNKEIKAVKSRLVKINVINEKSEDVKIGEVLITTTTDETIGVFSANSERSDERMEVSEPTSKESVTADGQQSDDTDQEQTDPIEDSAAEESPDFAESGQQDDITKILEDAEKLFDERDYNGTLDKLNEVNNMIDDAGADSGAEAQDTASTIDNMDNKEDELCDEAEDTTETDSSIEE